VPLLGFVCCYTLWLALTFDLFVAPCSPPSYLVSYALPAPVALSGCLTAANGESVRNCSRGGGDVVTIT
jgi:hypothetical protein